MTHDIPDNLLQLPDAEKFGVIKNGRRENSLDPTLDSFKGIPVQHADEDTIFGNPEGFLQRLFGIINEFQGGKKTGVVK